MHVTAILHHECPQWAEQHLDSHIDCHVMRWRLSNNMPHLGHVLHDDPPAAATAATTHFHCQLPTFSLVHSNHNCNNPPIPSMVPSDLPRRPDGNDATVVQTRSENENIFLRNIALDFRFWLFAAEPIPATFKFKIFIIMIAGHSLLQQAPTTTIDDWSQRPTTMFEEWR
ncbi:uncharacterized protein LACBIDRAFT_329912 [Laccaria bicolor S238N-H82]|uniref:Predicted protein n=1 Tax=Laccaria bicolor (strain S238N-H82 / ATCC MYA-4686) TaxID=486041 RepID=B0DJL6_LACBS|nr:uncharacterized protein LACBIDRAFT_329912 [Laccaria bicolor S238N-H82]EDR05140.1 predicted protein [Laccaria bicolor S238N-H82]|eukprot:XP_001884105.1 predicted protein [Laccaria bicolor S238N-H82]